MSHRYSGLVASFAFPVAAFASHPAVAQESLQERVDRLFAPWTGKETPGGAVAVVMAGKVVLARGYGMADLDNGVAITPETIFPIASVSKQFTAFAIATLAEEGRLSLDDDVRKHLPAVPDFGEKITLRHLVHHTSGLRDVVELRLMSGLVSSDVATRERYWELVKGQRELNFPPGTEHLYCNTGYFVLAEVVSAVSGRPFRTWMQERVFGPLRMTRTHVHDDPYRLVPGRAYGYQAAPSGGFMRNPVTAGTYGESGIFSTVTDLAAWVANLGSKEVGGERVSARMRETGRLASGEALGYAFGLTVDRHRGLERLSHGGRSCGFLANVAYYPAHDFGVVVLANGYPMQPLLNPGAMSNRIAEICLGSAMTQPTDAVGTPQEAGADVPETDLERVAGWYWHPDRNYTRGARLEDGRLMFLRSGNSRSPLQPLGGDRFRILEVAAPIVVSFEPVGEKPRRMVVAGPGGTEVFVAVDELAPTTDEYLRAFEGTYYSPELEVAHTYFVRDGRLIVQCMGRGESALRPIIEDHFNQGSPWWLGYDLHFQRDRNGAVTGLRVSNYHAQRVRFVKLELPK